MSTEEIEDEIEGALKKPERKIVIEHRNLPQKSNDPEKAELQEKLGELKKEKKYLEAQRLEQRTLYDIEMIKEVGYVTGIENYSRHFDGREPGQPPNTLIDFFKSGFLTIIDESHVTVPQIQGMYNGDLARKKSLIEYGFRLPSAKDNRPLTFDEFEEKIGQTIYMSATPGSYELRKSKKLKNISYKYLTSPVTTLTLPFFVSKIRQPVSSTFETIPVITFFSSDT